MNALPCLIVSGLCLSVAARAATPTVALALGNPRAVAVDAARNLYVGDVESAKIYRIAADGQVTVLGAGGPAIGDPIGLAVDRSGNVYAADADGGAVYRIPAGGAAAALGKSGAPGSSANFSTPTSVAVDASGNVYVANNGANTVLRVTPDGTISDFAGRNGVSGSADGKGSAALFAAPRGLAVDGRGNVYVADEGNCNIRRIAPDGTVSTLAGLAGTPGTADGTGTAARFGAPRALAADAGGTVYVADTDNHTIRRITPAGVVTTLAGKPGEAAMADGTGAAARFSEPRGIAVDTEGNLYVADSGNGVIRRIAPGGVVTTLTAAPKP